MAGCGSSSAAVAASVAASFASRYGATINWFPGHMAKSVNQLSDLVHRADVVVEVRDARLPFTSGNPVLTQLCSTSLHGGISSKPKPRIIVFNKADLANEQLQARLREWFAQPSARAEGIHGVVFTSAVRTQHVAQILAMAAQLPSKAAAFRTAGATMVVVGVPNVGKSSIINALRASAHTIQSKGAKTGASPGITRSVSAFKLNTKPPLYVFDSPGIMLPRIESVEAGMKLAVTNALPDTIIPKPVLAEYLLYYFHGIASQRYVKAMGLSRAYPPDEVELMLTELSDKLHARLSGGAPDLDVAAKHFVSAYQSGQLGRFTLDIIPQPPPLLASTTATQSAAVAAAVAAVAANTPAPRATSMSLSYNDAPTHRNLR